MEKNKEIAIEKSDTSMEAMITHALDKGASIKVMERMFAMRNEFMAQQAKAAYIQALSDFQSEVPTIKKTKKVLNKDGRTVRYQFAPLDSITDQIKKPLKEYNLSYRWETKQDKTGVRAIAIVTHIMGHSESSEFEVPIDTEGYMTQPQKFASALTFAKRYSLCNALGLSTGDEDTDATDVRKEPEAKSQKSKIIFLLRTLGEKTDAKPLLEEATRRLAGLTLEEKNFAAIIKKLEAKVITKNHENNDIQ